MSSEEKVHVSIQEINNGFVFHRSWCEGKGNKTKYHSEDYFMEDLPGPLKNLFTKGYMKDVADDDMWDAMQKEKLMDEEESGDEE